MPLGFGPKKLGVLKYPLFLDSRLDPKCKSTSQTTINNLHDHYRTVIYHVMWPTKWTIKTLCCL